MPGRSDGGFVAGHYPRGGACAAQRVPGYGVADLARPDAGPGRDWLDRGYAAHIALLGCRGDGARGRKGGRVIPGRSRATARVARTILRCPLYLPCVYCTGDPRGRPGVVDGRVLAST